MPHISHSLWYFDNLVSRRIKSWNCRCFQVIIPRYSVWYLVAYDLFPTFLCLTPTKQQSAIDKGKREEDDIAIRVARRVGDLHISKVRYRYKQGRGCIMFAGPTDEDKAFANNV